MVLKKKVYLFIYDGFADREVSHLMSCLVKCNRYVVKTIALDKTAKQSLSGLSVVPDFDFIPQVDLKDIDESNTELLVFPGGTGWEDKISFEMTSLMVHCIDQGITVAASGESTLLLAESGLLNDTLHTSINATYLNTFSAAYHGVNNYVHDATVCHEGIITTSGRDPIDFSNTVLKALDVNTELTQFFYEGVMFE
jgi:transcriptional regulator GlxA family with amidase domain